MNALTELRRLQQALVDTLATVQLEADSVNKAIEIFEREQNKLADQSARRANGKEFSGMGLADSCRKIVGSKFISPLEVRNELVAGGYPIKSTKGKLLGSVYSTMRRSQIKGDFEARKEDGRWYFRKKSKKGEIT